MFILYSFVIYLFIYLNVFMTSLRKFTVPIETFSNVKMYLFLFNRNFRVTVKSCLALRAYSYLQNGLPLTCKWISITKLPAKQQSLYITSVHALCRAQIFDVLMDLVPKHASKKYNDNLQVLIRESQFTKDKVPQVSILTTVWRFIFFKAPKAWWILVSWIWDSSWFDCNI